MSKSRRDYASIHAGSTHASTRQVTHQRLDEGLEVPQASWFNTGVHLRDLPTPSVLVDRTRLFNNINAMQAAASVAGLRLRPHAKTHKSPRIARWQLDAGAVGITLAKVAEAEVFAEAGVDDIRLAYPVPTATASRVVDLMDRVRLSLCVDHLGVATRWSEAMVSAARNLDVLVKVDVGYHRCGIDPGRSDAVEFVSRVAALPGLRFLGVLSHAGQSYMASSDEDLVRIAREEAATLRALVSAVRTSGVPVEEISVGSTPTASYSFLESGLTEARPGNYVFFDLTQVALGSASMLDCALTVLATVVSTPSAHRLVLDAGSKTLSSDDARGPGARRGFGAVCPDASRQVADDAFVIERLSEEHAVVSRLPGATALEPGDRVRIVPNHACVVANLTDTLRLVEGDAVIEDIPVAARGKNS